MENRIYAIYQRACNKTASLLSTDELEDASFAFSEFVQAKSLNEKYKRDFLALDAFAELVVKNFLLDRHRQLKRRRETPLYSVDAETGEQTPLEFADERDSPEIEALKREGWIGLRVVDPYLSAIDIKTLQLRFEGYDYSEIAESLNKTEYSVQHIASRALKRLRETCKRKGLKAGDIMEILYPFSPPPPRRNL